MIAPSEFNKKLLIDRGCAEEKIRVIPNAIDRGAFNAQTPVEVVHFAGLPANVPLILSVGRLEPQKNTLEFVRIAQALVAHRRLMHFVVVGDAVNTADYAAQVHAAASAVGKDLFSFIPRIRYVDMPT